MSVKRARGPESMVRQGKGKELALTGLMAALFCVVGPLSVPLPFSPVPISLTNLAIYFSLYILGMKRGCFSYLIYLLIGFTGVPVFPHLPEALASCWALRADTLSGLY